MAVSGLVLGCSMAGSKRYFKYTTDTNQDYSVELDESNSEVIVSGGQLMPNREAPYPFLPKGLKMRYFLGESVGVRKLQRKFYIGDTSLLIGLGTSIVLNARPYPDSEPVDWIVTAYRGEKVPFIKPVSIVSGDTGLNDGDQGIDEPTVQ